MKKLTHFFKPYTKLLIIGPIFKLFEAILELLLPLLMSMVIDNGVAKGDKHYILTVGGIMIITATVGVCCALICQYSASFVSQGTGTDIRNVLFEHIGTFSNAEIDKFGTSSLINRITNDVNQIQLAVAMLIRLVIRAPFLCIGGFIMTCILDYQLSIVMIIVIPIFILILYLIMKKSVPLYRTVQKKLDGIALIIRENLGGVRVIRAFARTEYEQERFAAGNKEYADNAIKVGKISALLNPITNLIMNFAIGVILWFGGIRVNIGSMTTGEVIAFIGYTSQILAALIVISNLVVIFTKAYASAGRVVEVFDTNPSITNPVNFTKSLNPRNKAVTVSTGTENKDIAVEFRDVSMSYHVKAESSVGANGINYDVEHISFRVKRGETIGIIGGTGSGKSTIVNLIPRFYDITQGSLFVNGIDVRDYDLDILRSKIGIVPQKTVLFTGTIAENIRWGKKDATAEDIKRAVSIAQASEFIEKLPDKYDTMITRGGVNVSGGQRQRLTIARALVRKPEILILDDSFNALDYATDAALRKAMKQNSTTMTTLIISQRASTIKNADQIIVLNEGYIAGIGKHDDLLEHCEVYQEICQSQEMNGVSKAV
jgi:ATP-binding cassette subfamily B multidrug efflux pump